MAMRIQAYLYGGQTFLKFGKKASPGVMYRLRDLETGQRPDVELWRDGTITYHDRPEGDVSLMRKVTIPLWAYDYKIKRFKGRS
jgi:hypothetical protein